MRGVEEAERPQGKGKHTTKRGKDLLLAQIMQERFQLVSQGGMLPNASEVAELNVLAAVGARRRRRWNNERVLRELAGPMTAEEMHSQFNPVPFGFRAPTAFEIVARPQHAEIWDGFRNVDIDRQARVLERWEQHNKEQAAAARRAHQPQRMSAPSSSAQQHEQAAQALKQWGNVSRKARAALRKANVHTVLGLESQLLDHMDASVIANSSTKEAQGGYAVPPLSLPGLDAWGRLLVHGLAEFHGLSSSTRPAAGASQQQQQQQQQLSPTATECGEACAGRPEKQQHVAIVQGGAADSTLPLDQIQGPMQSYDHEEQSSNASDEVVITVFQRQPRKLQTEAASPSQQEGAQEPDASGPAGHNEITCCDVLMALAASHSGSLSAKKLHNFVKSHIHGSETSSVAAEGGAWVLL